MCPSGPRDIVQRCLCSALGQIFSLSPKCRMVEQKSVAICSSGLWHTSACSYFRAALSGQRNFYFYFAKTSHGRTRIRRRTMAPNGTTAWRARIPAPNACETSWTGRSNRRPSQSGAGLGRSCEAGVPTSKRCERKRNWQRARTAGAADRTTASMYHR